LSRPIESESGAIWPLFSRIDGDVPDHVVDVAAKTAAKGARSLMNWSEMCFRGRPGVFPVNVSIKRIPPKLTGGSP